MDVGNISVPGHENDKIVIATRRHIASMLTTIFLIIFMTILPAGIVIAMAHTNPAFFTGIFINFLVIILSIVYLIIATFTFAQWVSYYYDVFVVTDKEILDVDQNSIFDRRITEVSLLRIQDVSARITGFLPTIFGYGDVVAESAGENSRTYVIDCIPHPVEVANKILALHNEHVEREDRAAEMITAEGDLRSRQLRPSLYQTANQPQPQESSPFAGKPASTENVCPPYPPVQTAAPQAVEPQVINTQSPAPAPTSVPAPAPMPLPQEQAPEGVVQKDDLDKGGEVQL